MNKLIAMTFEDKVREFIIKKDDKYFLLMVKYSRKKTIVDRCWYYMGRSQILAFYNRNNYPIPHWVYEVEF